MTFVQRRTTWPGNDFLISRLHSTRLTDCLNGCGNQPEVIALRHVFQIPEDGTRLAVLQLDGLEFVEARKGSFDILMVDAFNMLGQPPHLCTDAFYQACRRSLTPEGILVVNLCHEGSRIACSRIELVFSRRAFCLQAADGLNRVVIIGKKNTKASDTVLQMRAKGLELLHPLQFQPIADQVLHQ